MLASNSHERPDLAENRQVITADDLCNRMKAYEATGGKTRSPSVELCWHRQPHLFDLHPRHDAAVRCPTRRMPAHDPLRHRPTFCHVYRPANHYSTAHWKSSSYE